MHVLNKYALWAKPETCIHWQAAVPVEPPCKSVLNVTSSLAFHWYEYQGAVNRGQVPVL